VGVSALWPLLRGSTVPFAVVAPRRIPLAGYLAEPLLFEVEAQSVDPEIVVGVPKMRLGA